MLQVMLLDRELAEKYMIGQGDVFTDRPQLSAVQKAFKGGSFGIIETCGPVWADMRRFSLRVLRDLGMGKQGVEQRVSATIFDFDFKLQKKF